MRRTSSHFFIDKTGEDYYNNDISEYGWYADGKIQWVEDVFPDDVSEILVQSNESDGDDDELFENYSSDESDAD